MSDAVKRYRPTQPGDKGHGIEGIWGISTDGTSALLTNAELVLATAYDALEAENVRLRCRLILALKLADELLEDLELHGLQDDLSWNYRYQKANFRALAASNDKGDGP